MLLLARYARCAAITAAWVTLSLFKRSKPLYYNNNNNKSIYIAPILSSAKRFTMWLKSKSLKIITYICT